MLKIYLVIWCCGRRHLFKKRIRCSTATVVGIFIFFVFSDFYMSCKSLFVRKKRKKETKRVSMSFFRHAMTDRLPDLQASQYQMSLTMVHGTCLAFSSLSWTSNKFCCHKLWKQPKKSIDLTGMMRQFINANC